MYELNDFHTTPYFGLFPAENFSYICPLNLSTRYNNETDEAKMYGSFIRNKELYYLFKNNEHVVNVIEKNLNTSIESINGKNPFSFIQEFAGIKMRNKHSTYVFNQLTYTYNNFYIPATEKDLTNFTVVYSNGDNFTTDYLIVDTRPGIQYKEKAEDNKIKSEFSQNELFSNWPLKSYNDINLYFENMHNIKNNNLNEPKKQSKNDENEIDWKYSYTSLDNGYVCFQCRVDEKNKVNVLRLNTFGGASDSDPSLEIAEKCAYLFDENDYRIVIIFPRNGGGNPVVGYNIIELLSPYILTRNTIRMRKDENMGKLLEQYNLAHLFVELNSTKEVNADYIKDGFVNETYGDKIEEFSKPFSWRVNQTKIEEIKKKLKHKRFPTEIVIMTDGFAFSAASAFMKNAYKSGAGIIVGYNGNPTLPDDIYDISQSPSPVFGVNNYYTIYPEIVNNTAKYGFGLLSLTCMASYHEFQESHIPQEYDVQNPDKRVKLFNPYDDSYYQDFINEAIIVLESFKNNCNPKHPMLVLLSEECKFDNKLLHGGYGCGSDSKWNKSNCVPVYCDTGYYYNRISNSCIEYPMEKQNDKKEDKDNVLMIILIVVGSLVVISVIIFIIILYKKHSLCFKKNEKEIDPNYNDNEMSNLIPTK